MSKKRVGLACLFVAAVGFPFVLNAAGCAPALNPPGGPTPDPTRGHEGTQGATDSDAGPVIAPDAVKKK